MGILYDSFQKPTPSRKDMKRIGMDKTNAEQRKVFTETLKQAPKGRLALAFEQEEARPSDVDIIKRGMKDVATVAEQIKADTLPEFKPTTRIPGLITQRLGGFGGGLGKEIQVDVSEQQHIRRLRAIRKGPGTEQEKDLASKVVTRQEISNIAGQVQRAVQAPHDLARFQEEAQKLKGKFLKKTYRRWERGSAMVVGGGIHLAEELTRIATLGKYGDTPAEYAKMYHDVLKQPEMVPVVENAVDKYFGGAVETAPFLLTALAPAAVSGGAAVPSSIAGFLTAYSIESNNTYQAAKDRGLSERAARIRSVPVGLINGGIEVVGGSGGKYFKNKRAAIKAMTTKLGKAKVITRSVLKNALKEGLLEELPQEAVSMIVGGDIPRKKDGSVDYDAIAERLTDATVMGTILGGVIGAPISTVQTFKAGTAAAKQLEVEKRVRRELGGLRKPPVTEAVPGREPAVEPTKPAEAPIPVEGEVKTIKTSIGNIEIPSEDLDVKWDKALEVIFNYGNQEAAGLPNQADLPRSLSVGDTVEYEGKNWLLMPQGWQDVSHLSQEGIDKLVGSMKIPLPPKPKKGTVARRKLEAAKAPITTVEREKLRNLGMTIEEIAETPAEELRARLILSGETLDAKAEEVGAEITEPPPLDITEEPPGGKPTAEHGESFIKRVTRRAEAGLKGRKEYGTPKSLLSNVKGLAVKIKAAAKLSIKAQRTIAKEKKAFLRRATYLAGKFVEKEIAKGEMSPAEINDAKIKFFAGEQYAKQRWEPVKIEKEQRDALHEYILQHPALGLLTSRDTAAALNKLLDGYYLTNGEVGMIAEVFPELGMEASKRRAPHNKVLDLFLAVTGIPKTIKASFDVSLLGRQAFPLLMAHPSMIAPGIWQSLKLFGRRKSAEYSKAFTAEMKADPAWKRAKDMGIAIIEPGELSEEFPTRIAGKIPGIARSERAFIDIGNLLRVGAHSMIEDAYARKGKPLSDDASKALAQAINDLSGRASMPKDLKGLSIVASTVLWSPRLLMARAKAPFRTFSRNAAARNLAIRSFSTMAMIATLLALIAKWGHERNEDIDAELNPLSTDFLKIRWKNQHIDLTAGYGPMIRTVARLATGMTKTAAGEIREKKRLETIKQFGRAKGAPAVGLARKAITRKDWLGRPAYRPPKGTVGEAMTELGIPDAGQIVLKEFYDELLPLPIVDVADAGVIDGWVSGVVAAPLVFGGIGVLAYEPWESTQLRIEQNKVAKTNYGKKWDELTPAQQKRLGKTPTLQKQQLKADIEELYQRDEYEIDKVRYKIYREMPLSVRKELDSIGVAISAPSRSLGKFKLSDERYEVYKERSTALMREKLSERFGKEDWESLSLKSKQEKANERMNDAKAKARTQVLREINQGKL